MRFSPPEKERGAALLTVLLLVAVMSVIAATALDRLNLATRLAANGSAMAQARAYSYAAENIAAKRLEDLIGRDSSQLTTRGDWLDQDIPVPLDNGSAVIRILDANNCFNLNSLVTRQRDGLVANPQAIVQLRNLIELRGADENAAFAIAESAADWIDSDGEPLQGGAEDSHYRGLDTPYLPPNRLIADKSELKLVRGITPEIYDQISDYICALPVAEESQINVNTLSPERAELFAMLIGDDIDLQQAKAILANRPEAGYGSLVRFWNRPVLQGTENTQNIRDQVVLTSRWFRLRSRIGVGTIELQSLSLLSATNGAVALERRSWGEAF